MIDPLLSLTQDKKDALNCWAQIDHFARLFMHQQEVLVRMGPLLTAVMGFLPGMVVQALAPSLGAVYEQIRGALVDQLAVGHLLTIALRRHFQQLGHAAAPSATGESSHWLATD